VTNMSQVLDRTEILRYDYIPICGYIAGIESCIQKGNTNGNS